MCGLPFYALSDICRTPVAEILRIICQSVDRSRPVAFLFDFSLKNLSASTSWWDRTNVKLNLSLISVAWHLFSVGSKSTTLLPIYAQTYRISLDIRALAPVDTSRLSANARVNPGAGRVV